MYNILPAFRLLPSPDCRLLLKLLIKILSSGPLYFNFLTAFTYTTILFVFASTTFILLKFLQFGKDLSAVLLPLYLYCLPLAKLYYVRLWLFELERGTHLNPFSLKTLS